MKLISPTLTLTQFVSTTIVKMKTFHVLKIITEKCSVHLKKSTKCKLLHIKVV